MDREPTYPEDAPVGTPASGRESDERVAEADEAKAGESNRTRNFVAGAAIGVGSAALVAALLYANRSRKGGKPRKD